MTGTQVRQKYLDFFKSRGHSIIPSAPLVPENDPTTLFTSSGMQPLVPYLLGQKHPSGTKIVDSQKSFRSQDIEEVGDNRHTTFFEMLGNWSLGDYFKEHQLPWIWEFVTQEVGLNPNNLFVTVFSGDAETGVSRDEESIKLWKEIFSKSGISAEYVELGTEAAGYEEGMQGGRIFGYGVKKNWWSRSGVPANMPPGEPGGPDSEIFYDFGTPHDTKFGPNCHPNCDCGRFLEIGNSVFMQYQKLENGELKELSQKNVDFGGGLERLVAASNGDPDVFNTDLFAKIISEIESRTGKYYKDEAYKSPIRVIADHLKAATFLIVDGVRPSNKTQGYFLRRLLRRAAVKMYELKNGLTPDPDFSAICYAVLETYEDTSYMSKKDWDTISGVISEEIGKFSVSLDKGLKEFNKLNQQELTVQSAFDLFQTHGFPFEVSQELFAKRGVSLSGAEFLEIMTKHKDLSRTASKGMFKGGLQDQSETTTKYHTATHLLHSSLRKILGTHVTQKGSNITSERLRFDFSHDNKLTPEEIKRVEDLINQTVAEDIPVTRVEMPKSQALAEGALAFFPEKYPDITSVYSIGNFSKELCGGPHVNSTGQIGRVKITKEESAGSGIRRIYIQLAD